MRAWARTGHATAGLPLCYNKEVITAYAAACRKSSAFATKRTNLLGLLVTPSAHPQHVPAVKACVCTVPSTSNAVATLTKQTGKYTKCFGTLACQAGKVDLTPCSLI